jgi:predicted Zn finger-like uncharacterized protein
MNVSCPQCKTRYSVDDSRIPPSGVSIKCPKCTHTFVAKKDQGDGAVALPGNVAPKAPSRESSAVALPGNVAAKPKIPAATTDAGLDSDLDLGLDDDMPAPKKAAPPPKPKAPPPSQPAKSFTESGVLDFIDDTGKKAGPGGRSSGGSVEYRVRRRNGRVEGPFGVGRLVAMIKNKDLAANEDLSEDGVTWKAMTSVPELNKAINEVMAAEDDLSLSDDLPAKRGAGPAPRGASQDLSLDDEPPPSRGPAPKGKASPSIDEMMAELDLDQDSKPKGGDAGPPPGDDAPPAPRGAGGEDLQVGEIPDLPPLWKTYRKPILAFVGVMALVLLGVFTHLSRFGIFFIPGILAELTREPPPPPPEKPPPPPAKVVSPEELANLINEGSYEAFRSIFATIESAGPTLPDNMLALAKARGMATLAYGSTAFPLADLTKAVEALNTLDLGKAMGGNAAAANVEILKSRSALEILTGAHESAATQLAALVESRSDDKELALLLGLARAKGGDAKGALEALDKALVADSRYALAIHAIGDIVAAQGDANLEDAAFWYAKALRAQPAHSRSGVAAAALYEKLHRTGARRRILFETAENVSRGLPPAERPLVLYETAKAFDRVGILRQAGRFAEEAARLDPTNANYIALAGVAMALSGRGAQSVAALDAQLQRTPNDLETVLARARAHMKMEEVAKAFLDLETAAKQAPRDHRPSLWEARFDLLLGKLADARTALEKAARLADTDVVPKVELGRLELNLGDVDAALTQAKAAVTADPNSARALALLGDCLSRRAELSEAIETYRKAFEIDDEILEARVGYANTLRDIAMRQGAPRESQDLAASVPLYLAALNDQPDNPQIIFEYGRALELEGRLQNALALYREASMLDEKDVRPHLRMVQAFIEQSPPALDEAASSLKRAQSIELSSGRPSSEVRFWEARLALLTDRVHDAVSALRTATEFEPKNAVFHYWMGRALERNNSLYEAITYYEKAVSLNSRYAEAHRALGWASVERHKFDQSRVHFEAFRAAAPEDKTIWNDIGESYVRQNKDNEALGAFEKVLEHLPQDVKALVQVGNILSRRGKEEDATKYYRRAVKADESNGEATCQLGIALARGKVSKEAEGLLKRCLKSADAPEDMKDSAQSILDTAGIN